MKAFRMAVVMVVLSAMFSPAAALAKSEPRTPPVAAQQVPAAEPARSVNAASGAADEASRYAQREQQAQDQQNFKGGAIYVVAGSGLVLALLIIILVLVV